MPSSASEVTFLSGQLMQNIFLRRKFFAIPPELHRYHLAIRRVMIVEPRGAHIAERFVMPVGFPVRRYAHELRILAVRVPGVRDASAEYIRVAEKVLEAHRARKPRIVEKHVKIPFAESVPVLVLRENAVRARRIDIRIRAALPFFRAEFAETFRLRRGKDHELNAFADKVHDDIHVDGGFREPHRFRLAVEMAFKIPDSDRKSTR